MSTPRSRQRASLETVAGLVVLLALAAPSAQALKSDREQPLDVTANHFQTDQNKHVTVLTGAVHLTQGSIKGEADKGTMHQDDASQITRVLLEGKPARLAQQLDDGGMVNARAANIDYDAAKNVAVLTGDAVVIQEGRGEFRGERIVYNIESGEVTGGDETPGSRVHLHVLPKAKDTDAASKPALPAKDDAAKKDGSK